MTKIIALDTETTGLDPATEEVFEIGAVDIDTGQEFQWRIQPLDETVARMHPKAVEVNRYHERTAASDWTWDDTEDVVSEVYHLLHGNHMLGAVPDFDARHLTALFANVGHVAPRWHYHLIDVEAMAVGWLAGAGDVGDEPLPLPWDSDDLSRRVGIEPPSGDDRHTALSDARWAAHLYLAMTR